MKMLSFLLFFLTLSLVQGQLPLLRDLTDIIRNNPPLDHVIKSLETTLKLVSEEAVNRARAATAPVIQIVNNTAQEARKTLGDLAGEVTIGAVRARAAGWDAMHCAQEKGKQAEDAIKEAMAKLDSCAALATLEVQSPVRMIDNLTQEAVQRIDTSTEDVADCLTHLGTHRCLRDLIQHLSRDVGDITEHITKQAMGAEQSVAHVARQITSCVSGQVKMARKLVHDLDIDSCTKA